MTDNIGNQMVRRGVQSPAPPSLCGLVAVLFLCLTFFPAIAPAKPFEQTGTFGGLLKAGEVSEEAQLNGVSGLAVNYTGAGGVSKGTVYAVTNGNGDIRVARFTPEKGGMKFVERWEIADSLTEKQREEQGEAPYAICGPATADAGEGLTGELHCAMSPAGGAAGLGVAVDQTTGLVYVGRPLGNVPTGRTVIHAYTANGSEVVARFGEQGPNDSGELEAQTPQQIHWAFAPGYLAVNGNGEVFVSDVQPHNKSLHRLMVFKPKLPGVYSEYVYAGQSSDIGVGTLSEGQPNPVEQPVVDENGYVYVKGNESVDKYDPATPDAPICTFSFPPGGITAMTVNPETGEPSFFSRSKRPRRIHALSACKDGVFEETGETELAPESEEITALTLDPARQLSAGREPGVLYGATPNGSPKAFSGLGYIFSQPEENPAVIGDLEPVNVTSSSATLSAVIDPKGFTTHYAFLYLSQAEYEAQGEIFAGAAEAPAGGADLSPAAGAQRIEASVTGLEPNTTYLFRVVASSKCSPTEPTKVCPVESPVASLHTYAIRAPGLADGRGYELVSPAEKQGGQVLPADPSQRSCARECKPGAAADRFPAQSTPDGGAVVFEGEPFGPDGALIENEYYAERNSDGWSTTTLAPPSFANRDSNGYRAFDPSLTVGVLRQGTPALTSSTPGEYRNLYQQPTAEPKSFTSILTTGNSVPTCLSGGNAGSLRVTYSGGSTDLAKVFFEANDALTPESTGACEESNLYEGVAGSLRAVNIPPGGGSSVPGAVFGSGQLLRSGNPNVVSRVVTHAISANGSRAFFTGADGHLYVRLNGATTLEVPATGNCNTATPLVARVCFLTASTDGDSVLMSDGQVYEINETETAYEASTDLTQGQGGFLGLAGQSDDLDHVYFVDTANLTGSEENDQGAVAEAGQPNLYSSAGGSTSFIAALDPKDGASDFGDWTASPVVRTAQASSSGRWLAFQSVSPLTGYENVGPCRRNTVGEFVFEGRCVEAYLYDAQAQALTCASCNPSGARPVGNATFTTYYGAEGSLAQAHYLTDAGRLIFDSSDRLVPGDANGRVEDVYEYEPEGVGGCAGSSCLSLISSGRGSSDSNFLTMDETGKNVFFTTRDRLVGADKDELIDLYDARVGGGFPEPQPPAQCKGEACQQVAPPPGQPTPSSMGLPAEADAKHGKKTGCKKGKVKRNGRCVKKRKGHKGKKPGARHERKGDN